MTSWLARGGFPPGTFRTGPYCDCGCHQGVLVITGRPSDNRACCPCPDAGPPLFLGPPLKVRRSDD